jgi:chaperonin cofactor prefoldin
MPLSPNPTNPTPPPYSESPMDQVSTPRSEHLRVAALAEVKTARNEVKDKASEIKVLEDQLSRTKEQLGSAQMTIASMVSRSELTAAEALLNELQLLFRTNEERNRKSVDCLQEQAREYKSEIDELKAAIQANVHLNF